MNECELIPIVVTWVQATSLILPKRPTGGRFVGSVVKKGVAVNGTCGLTPDNQLIPHPQPSPSRNHMDTSPHKRDRGTFSNTLQPRGTLCGQTPT